MRYTVVWQSSAERELTEIWLKDAEQARVAKAADELDRELREEPVRKGESRERNRRILIISPLTITYVVREADMLVKVIKVRRHTQ